MGWNQPSCGFFRLNEGAVVGVAGLETYGGQGLLRSVAVAEGMQGKGYGVLLVKNVVDQAKKLRVEELFLLTTTASGFFEKLGFQAISREEAVGGITGSVEFRSACPKTAVLMHLKLG